MVSGVMIMPTFATMVAASWDLFATSMGRVLLERTARRIPTQFLIVGAVESFILPKA
jgi:hypothetical protein